MTSPLRSCGLGNSDVAFLMPCLGIVENLTDAVDWSLYDPDPPEGGGVWWIDLHRLRSRGLLAPRTQRRLRELGPDGVLTFGTRSGLQELGPDLGWAPGAKTWLPPYPLILLRGLGPGTQNRPRGLPLALGVAMVLAVLRPAACSRLQL
jgi:hypothetical protein